MLVTGGAAAAQTPSPTQLRVELSVDIDYVDPALSYYVPTWAIEYATCAKLVNYPDRPAPEGSRLQPEVARAMPTVSPDGKTYTFELRDDFVFSPPSNERVTAAHFKWAIDRALNRQMNSPSQPFLGDIVGAQDVINGTTNSTSGVVADGNTLRITLVQPEGDFLARLAMPFTCPLPALGSRQSKRNRRPGSVGGAVLHRRLDTQPRGPRQGEPELHGQPAAPLRRDPLWDRPPARDDQAPDRPGRDGLGRHSARGPRRAWHALRDMHARRVAEASRTSATRRRPSSTWR